jgi:RNA polymerase sigma-70 factor (ECF subfamily)
VGARSATRKGEPGSDVLDRARAGDKDAFAVLVRHYDPGLRALAYRLLGTRDRMDDALQEAYVRAYRALPRFRGDANVGTWLYRIVYNACLDELERGRRGGLVILAELPEQEDAGPGPAEATARRDELARALGALAPELRAAVLLVDAQGFTYRAAGRVLGVPEGTVASRLSQARAILRAALGEEEEALG